MCGRFTLTAGQRSALEDRFGASLPEGGLERFNVAPTETVLAVCGGGEGRLLRWGLIPHWAKDLGAGARMINARSETAGAKQPFCTLVGRADGRCLVLADGFYEWLRPEDRKQPRQPFFFTVDGGEPFAFAGLWTRVRIDGEPIESTSILTTAPNTVVARLHDRMPVILPDRDAEAAWLSGELTAEEALALCRPLDGGRMRGAPANPAVNRPDPDGEGPHLLAVPG
ncbi:MAG: SOS response-associated peptidase [Actinomycetota bacterium]|nr:SOS response-associated peptidase [Actinomycetota bacterium]